MTPEAWEAALHFAPLYDWLASTGRLSERRARLYGCACCRLFPWGLSSGRAGRCLDVTERYVDGDATDNQLKAARRGALKAIAGSRGRRWLYEASPAEAARAASSVAGNPYLSGVRAACEAVIRAARSDLGDDGQTARAACDLLRDIFGNPFVPVTIDPRWRTADVVGVARGVYEDRAFDRLPILADALMDAGCTDEAVLSHCRSDRPHARGCWVVDLVLGKR